VFATTKKFTHSYPHRQDGIVEGGNMVPHENLNEEIF